MSHSILSPSAAHRWMTCPGSVALCRGLPDSTSVHAAEGTAAHELAEDCLNSGTDARERIGDVIEVPGSDPTEAFSFKVDDEMASYVQQYVDNVRRAAAGGDLLVEQRLDLSDLLGIPEQGGTGDAVILDHLTGTVRVHDLKYGRGVKVYAERNPQLMLYGWAALEEHDLAGEFTQVTVVIDQPRLDHYDEWTLSADELRQWGAAIARTSASLAIRAWQMEPSEVPSYMLIPDEKACKFCPAKANCPALEGVVFGAAFDDLDAQVVNDPTGDGADDLGRKRALVSLVEDWCKAVVAETDQRLELGQPVSGWKLVQGRRGSRQWKDEEAAEKMLKKWRMRNDTMYKMTVISPTQAEKILTPARWEKAQELVVQKDGKPQAVPEADPRPALSPVTFDDETQSLL